MLRIGQFARLAGVSVKALRHYDAIDLLKPGAVGEGSRYRYYRPSQLRKLRRILDLKGLGFSLDVIRGLMEADCDDLGARERLRERREELLRCISRRREQLADVEARIEELERGHAWPPLEMLVSRTSSRPVATLRSSLSSYEEADAMLFELERRVDPRDRRGFLGAIWHGCAHEGTIDCEAFVPVRRGARISREISIRELPAMTMASVIHCGSDETHGETYALARKRITSMGRIVSGPNHEIYLSRLSPLSRLSRSRMSGDGDDANDDVTEIQFPIE